MFWEAIASAGAVSPGLLGRAELEHVFLRGLTQWLLAELGAQVPHQGRGCCYHMYLFQILFFAHQFRCQSPLGLTSQQVAVQA